MTEEGADYKESAQSARQTPHMGPRVLPTRLPPRPQLPSRQTSLDQKLNDPTVLKDGIVGIKHVQTAIWDDPDIPEGQSQSHHTIK